MIKHRYWFLISLMTLLFAGCGGGGGDGGSAGGGSAAPATVGVVLTDAPVEGYDKAIADICAIELIGGPDGPVTLHTGCVMIDLLGLRDYQEMFAIRDDVPPGVYSKIRLRIKSLELIKVDEDGNETDSTKVKLVANGKIDLNPQGPFDVLPDSVLFITLDWDMNKSIKLTFTGNGEVILRPVIFVRISDREPMGRLARIRGEVDEIQSDGTNFRLCRTERISQVSIQTAGDDLRGCVIVATGERSGLFGEDGLPIMFSDLMVGDLVTVIGRLVALNDDGLPEDDPVIQPLSHGDDDWDWDDDWDNDHDWGWDDCDEVTTQSSDDDCDDDNDNDDDCDVSIDPVDGDDDHCDGDRPRFGFAALVVERGAPGTFRIWRGETVSTVDPATSQFAFAFAPGQGFAEGSVIATQLFEKSWIISRQGAVLTPDEVQSGQRAAVDGVINLLDDGNVLRAALMLVSTEPEPDQDFLTGVIQSVDVDASTLIVTTDDTGDRTVDAGRAIVILVQLDEDGFDSKLGSLENLEPGQSVAIFGEEGIDGAFNAGVIVANVDQAMTTG